MRALFAAALLVALTVLAIPAPAQADPVPGCDPQTVGDYYTHASVDGACHVTVYADPWDCTWREARQTRTVGPVTVTFTYCVAQTPPLWS